MRRLLTDFALFVAGVVLLLLVLAAIDPRVRDQFDWRTASRPTGEVLDAGARVRATAMVVYRAARDKTEEHTALSIFVVAGVVLLVFMLRT